MVDATTRGGGWFHRLFGTVRLAYVPVLVPYFCYGASSITAIALLFFQKSTLDITPADAAAIAFWVALPWSTKMVAGVASDVYPILGSRPRWIDDERAVELTIDVSSLHQ